MHCTKILKDSKKSKNFREPTSPCKPDSVRLLFRKRFGCVTIFLTANGFHRSQCPFLLKEQVRLIPGDPAGRQPFSCLSCIARGLPCLLGYPWSGELLPPRFTLTRRDCSRRRRFDFCGTFRPQSLVSFTSPAFTGHAALRCPDFPLHIPQAEHTAATRSWSARHWYRLAYQQ